MADGNRNYRPSAYVEEFLDTRLTYEFATYKIIDQDEMSLRANPNPFAVCVLTCLLAMRNKNIDDERLKGIKHDLYMEMMNRRMAKEKRKGIYDFLTYFVSFQDIEMFRIFEKELLEKQGKDITMGTTEYLLDKAKKEERAKAEAEKLKSAKKMKDSGFDNKLIADILDLPIGQIEKL